MNVIFRKKPSTPPEYENKKIVKPQINYHPTLTYGELTFHAVKTKDIWGLSYDGRIDLYCHDQATASALECDVEDLCGYIQEIDRDLITFHYNSKGTLIVPDKTVETSYVYQTSCLAWLTEHLVLTGVITRSMLLG